MNLIVNFYVWDTKKEDFVLVELSSECPEREFCGGGQTDEGYSYWHEKYVLEEDYVILYSSSEARDCDGRMDDYKKLKCRIDRLFALKNEWEGKEYDIPQWEEDKSFQEDAYAQSMYY